MKKTSSTTAELEAMRQGLTGENDDLYDSQVAMEILKKQPSSKKE